MPQLYCLGEILVDIQCETARANPQAFVFPLAAFAGGAPANVAVAAARFGASASLCGPISRDALGLFLRQCMVQANVDLRHAREVSAPTAIAWITLDAQGDRSFVFARDGSADLELTELDVAAIEFGVGDILHVASNSLTHAQPARATMSALQRAREHGVTTSMDLNLRPGLWPNGEPSFETIYAAARLACVLKAEREEWNWLCARDGEAAVLNDLWSQGCHVIFVTAGGDRVTCISPSFRLCLMPPRVEVRDTTGAGDAFCGAFLSELIFSRDEGILRKISVDRHACEEVAKIAISAGACCVQKNGAMASLPTRQEALDLLERSDWEHAHERS
jgi:fructokinase